MAFSSEQQAEINRMSSERQAGFSVTLHAGTTMMTRFESKAVAELKARVNILSVSSASVTYAPENNYSSTEQTLINAVKPITKWGAAIPALLEDAQTLRDGGMAEASIIAILKQQK